MRERGATTSMLRRALAVTTVAAISLLGVAETASAHQSGPVKGWTQIDHTTASNAISGEGIATVYPHGAAPYIYYRAGGVISQPLKDAGWGHVGDPDSRGGYIFDAYQNTKDNPATNKMFLVTTPTGESYEYTHTLLPEEPAVNANASVAVSPDGQWMVGDTLQQLQELFVYPTPILNRKAPKPGENLPLTGRIKLDRPIRDAQGCDFVSSTRLLCSTSDPTNDLFPTTSQILQIDLAHPLRGTDTNARVTELGQVPMLSTCVGAYTTEGIDYDVNTGLLRVEVVPPSPCNTITDVYTFKRG
jgi:hypothetical protein